MNIAEAARAYTAQGWALVEFPTGTKGPQHHGWNEAHRVTTAPSEASLFTQNIGLCHAYSRTCCLDVDAWDAAEAFLRGRGVDLRRLVDEPAAVRVSSGRTGRAKLIYRLPDGVEPLPSKRPKDSGLELRCAASNGLTVQDVLPPSIHPVTGKPYVWEYGDPVAGHWSALPPLPEELLTLWRELIAPTTAGLTDLAPKGLDAARLRGMLSCLNPDLDYNEWAKVGMALHHETEGAAWGLDLWDEWSQGGSKYKDTGDLSTHWRSFGKSRGRPVTVQSLISMSGGVTADDFDDLENIPEQPKRPRFEVVPAAAFSAGPEPAWIVKGVLADAVLGVIFGESGAGKSFVILDLAMAIARGMPWNGRRVRQGRVVYVAAEGAAGLRKRTAAYARHFGADLASVPLGFVPDSPNLLRDDYKALAEQVNAWGGADLVIVDTAAQSMPGGDENSSEDMGKLLAHCRGIHALTGAMVVLVHHSGKDATKGARGWSGLKAACDTELEVVRNGDQRLLRASKQKDGEDGLAWGFGLKVVDMGQDTDGDPITSCVCEWRELEPIEAQRGEPTALWQKAVWRAVNDNASLCDGEVPVAVAVVSAADSMPQDPDKRDRRRELAMRALTELVQGGWLLKSGENVVVKNNK